MYNWPIRGVNPGAWSWESRPPDFEQGDRGARREGRGRVVREMVLYLIIYRKCVRKL